MVSLVDPGNTIAVSPDTVSAVLVPGHSLAVSEGGFDGGEGAGEQQLDLVTGSCYERDSKTAVKLCLRCASCLHCSLMDAGMLLGRLCGSCY